MDDLKKKGAFDKVAENQPVAPMDVRPIESTVGLESTLLEVWSLLQEKDVGIIGLYGLGGVGKTSLLAQINNKFCSMPVGYDIVIWLVVSKDHTARKIQEKIAEKIGLSNDLWKMKSCDGKARDIFTVLNKKKFVLFLDDLWERVDLIKVGIPLPSLENGSKLVFTTRHLEVCGKMEAQKKIKVECLGADESWKLFQDKVGEETLDSHPDIRKLAKMVAAECGGLPLALITIGRAMACKKIPEAWEYAIEVLKQSAHRFAGMEEEVFSLLIFSYDSLPSDTMRSCLLYFSLYPEDHVINKRNLIEYWFCEGLLDEFDSMRKALLQGYNIIDSLLNACLLEQAGEDYVRMHDVIRDMCLWIACEREAVEKRFFVQVGHQLGEAPDVGKWEGVRRMSLMRNQIVNLRSTPTCPNLRTLFLNKNTLKVISEGFFKLMPNLRVLNLSDNTDLRELPEGISELVSLEYLNLSGTGCFSKNCKSSYKFGRQVAKKLKQVVELKSKGVFDKVAENEPTGPVDVRPIEPTVGLESTLAKVWSLLQDKQVGMIGLYGLGGVGKTTLLTQVNNKLSGNPLDFDVVIWVVVSKDHTVETVQEKIGKRVGLFNGWMQNKSSDEKAVDIFRILSKRKFVLFLDDVWERVHLTKIGIPLPSQENGSMVVFTTRFLEICNEMEAQKVKVECLRANEAWELFREKVGEETLHSHPDIPGLAQKMAAKCGGLPLSLITIGRAMASKKTPQAWEYAIEVLKKSAHKLARMGQEVYPLLKFSYDSLHCDTMRSCLLYCGLYPEDVLILKSELIEYWFCEGLLDEFDSVRRARLQGYNIIDSLVNSCLLEEDGEYYVKMHDVIRDMTLWIAGESEAPEKSFFVQAGLQLTETPDVGKWENVRRLSLAGNKIKDLTSTPTCPNLETLLLNYNELEVISDGFFKLMPNLRVLNLAGNRGLRQLPEGISELVSLECLNLSRTGLRELSIKLKSLTKLRYLDLRYTDDLRRIPGKLITSFPKLQIFRMFRSGGGYSQEEMVADNEDGIVELGVEEYTLGCATLPMFDRNICERMPQTEGAPS
ncbi:Leucine-rich repeat - like 10 [Theobroma cacao]|nr:Leucine-rich repeat - like 10 [Theobroma cacao]